MQFNLRINLPRGSLFYTRFTWAGLTPPMASRCTDLPALEKKERKRAEQQMLRFVRQVKFGGVKFKTVVKTGHPPDHINAFAEKERIDLIITSTHGRTGFKHALMGSTAEQVVRRAPCSVLVVPSHPEVRVGNLRASRGIGRAMQQRQRSKKEGIPSADLSKHSTKLTRHPFPERRKTNRFRESHSRGS